MLVLLRLGTYSHFKVDAYPTPRDNLMGGNDGQLILPHAFLKPWCIGLGLART